MFGLYYDIRQDISNLLSYKDRELEFLNNSSAQIYYEPNLPHNSLINTHISHKIQKNIKTLSIMKDEEFMEKWSVLFGLFEKEYIKYKDSINCDYEFVKSEFNKSLYSILELSPDVVSIGAEEECIFIYAEYEEKSVFFNLFFEDETIEAVMNITENTNPILSYSNSIENSLQELKRVLGKDVNNEPFYDFLDLYV